MVATCSRDDFRAGRADWIANPPLELTRYGRHYGLSMPLPGCGKLSS